MRIAKWRTLKYAGCFSLIFMIMVSTSSPTDVDQLSAQKEALGVIADFADRLCGRVPLEGSEENLELSGEARAELSELIKKLANLGIEGAGKYQSSEYQGVLRKDLAAVLKGGVDCKLKVFQELKDELLVSNQPKQKRLPPKPTSNNKLLKEVKQKGLHAEEIQFGLVIRFRVRFSQRADGMKVLTPETERNLRRTAEILIDQARDRRIVVQTYGGLLTSSRQKQLAQEVAEELAKLGVEPERMTIESSGSFSNPKTMDIVDVVIQNN